jgi:hypothetical protein
VRLQLAPLLFFRPGELRAAEWSEINIDADEWNIPAEKMKMKVAHLVPLSRQALKVLNELKPLTCHSNMFFSVTVHNYAACQIMQLMPVCGVWGLKSQRLPAMVSEQGRAKFLTKFCKYGLISLNTSSPAHAVKDPNGRAYNRTAHLVVRKKIMQIWAYYLDGLKAGAKVIPFKREAA